MTTEAGTEPPPSGATSGPSDGGTDAPEEAAPPGDSSPPSGDSGAPDAACSCSLPHATTTCSGQQCAIAACEPGYSDCNRNASDGCETNLALASSCGSCSVACGPSVPVCSARDGGFVCTSGCGPSAPLLCGTECVDPQTSAAHCGACATSCTAPPNAVATCTAGRCGFTCNPPLSACGNRCVVSATDPTACGPACIVCPAAPNTTATCSAGVCGQACKPGYTDCNHNPADGCETPPGMACRDGGM